MPFEVFRRHQRKMLAVFAIMAMFGFVVSDSLPRLLSGDSGPRDNPVVVTLDDKPVRRTDLNEIAMQRQIANRFMANLIAFLIRRAPSGQFFGDYSDRALVDAMILDRQADELGLPRGPEFARRWLVQLARSGDTVMTKEVFQFALAPLADQVTGEQVLESVSEEVRRLQVQRMMSSPLVTPLDVFETYRDQNERVAVRAAVFSAERYLDKVGDPTEAQVQAYYDAHKNDLPDPGRATPGFKVPRQVVVELLSIDGTKLAREIKDKLTDDELRTSYENRKQEFIVPSELPNDLFADDPDATLTPPPSQPFEQVRDILANALAEERAQNEIGDIFNRVKKEELYPFADRYLTAVEDQAESKDASVPLPKPQDLTDIARREGLTREITPPLTLEAAQKYGQVSEAEIGLSRFSGGRRFTEEVFDPKTLMFEPFELTSGSGTRFLVRKIEDSAPRVPSLDEIRPEVVDAWKREQARDLARKAAETYAENLRKEGGQIKDEIVEGRPIIVTEAVAKMQPGMPLPDQFFQNGPAVPSLLPEFPYPGEELRDAIFGLKEGEVAIAPNAPKSSYFVVALDRREPATFDRLFGPSGTYSLYQRETMTDAATRRETDWMTQLRTQAGIAPDWVPEDEKERQASNQSG